VGGLLTANGAITTTAFVHAGSIDVTGTAAVAGIRFNGGTALAYGIVTGTASIAVGAGSSWGPHSVTEPADVIAFPASFFSNTPAVNVSVASDSGPAQQSAIIVTLSNPSSANYKVRFFNSGTITITASPVTIHWSAIGPR
jgi:hypothetical protein